MRTPSELRDRANEYRQAAAQLDAAADQIEKQESEIESIFGASLNGSAVTTKRRGRPKGTGKRGRPAGSKNKTKVAASGKKTGKRGRPPGSKNKKKAVAASGKKTGKRGRPVGSKNKSKDGEGKIVLADLILKILKEHKDGVALPGLVKECLKRGYVSKSQEFANIVYQTVSKLISKAKQVEKDDEGKYRLVA